MANPNSPEQLEEALRNFDRIATRLEDQKTRQIWQFEFNSETYRLHFYPRHTGPFRSSGGLTEFLHLTMLQKAGIPSPRAVAQLSGFQIGSIKGDAVILQTIPNAISLDLFLNRHVLDGSPVPNRRDIAAQIVKIIHDVGAAKHTHRALTLSCFVIGEGKVYLADAAGLERRGGFRLNDVFAFAHDAARFASRTELLRGWFDLNPGATPPRYNPVSRRLWRRLIRNSRRGNSDFGIIRSGEWSGFFTKTSRFAQPWSAASRLTISNADWELTWPILLAQIESGQLTPIKQDASGDVFEADLIVAGRPISAIVKRPKRKYRYRSLIDLFRPARAERMWLKAWTLIARNLPCEWPMLVMRRKKFGYTMDAVIVFERVPGVRLDQIDLDELSPQRREMLFRRAGRTLRAIERGGLVHYDSKSTNWIVYEGETHGEIPVMIDVDGIRPMNAWLHAWGILRLLRAMKNHPQYSRADSLALCQGFAPFAAGAIQPEVDSKS